MAQKIDEQNKLIELNEAKDRKRKVEIKKLIEISTKGLNAI